MVEREIEFEILASDFQRHLVSDKGKPDSELDQELPKMRKESAFEVALLSFLGNRQEIDWGSLSSRGSMESGHDNRKGS